MRQRFASAISKRLVCVLVFACSSATTLPLAQSAPDAARPVQPARPDFGHFIATDEARRVAAWVVRTGDHRGAPFLIIDKVAATAFVFEPGGQVQASAPVLLGVAKGDFFEAGSAEKDMYHTRIEERITPAGRYVAEPGVDDKGKDVLWINYDAGIALHAVLDNPGEQRRERLASVSPDDNRISYGCINVPTEFYHDVLRPVFSRTTGTVYVLPETRPASGFFEERRAGTRSNVPAILHRPLGGSTVTPPLVTPSTPLPRAPRPE